MVQLLTQDQVRNLLSEVLGAQLNELEKKLNSKNANDDLLSREQTAELLQINLSTLWAWTRASKLNCYGISGARRYYKRSEVLEALTLIKK